MRVAELAAKSKTVSEERGRQLHADVHETPPDVVTVATVDRAIHPAVVVVTITVAGVVVRISIAIAVVGISGGRADERASREPRPPPAPPAAAPPAAIPVPTIRAPAPARVSPTAARAAAAPSAAPAAAAPTAAPAEAAHAAMKAAEAAAKPAMTKLGVGGSRRQTEGRRHCQRRQSGDNLLGNRVTHVPPPKTLGLSRGLGRGHVAPDAAA